MIAYIEGHILRSEANLIVLKTSANIGYAVNVPLQISVKYSPEEFLSLHIHSNYREDDISLYGFQDLEEKKLFEMLIKTSGIGPKLGLAILSTPKGVNKESAFFSLSSKFKPEFSDSFRTGIISFSE